MSHPPTKTETVYQKLKHKLARGELAPGQRITEAKVASMFGVRRGPARESMLRLISEGRLAKNGAYGRTFVRYIEDDNREEVARRYELREMIEGLAARLAADHMNGLDVRELRHLDARVRDAVLTSDREARLKACLAFHRFLLARCGNDLLLQVAQTSTLLPMIARSHELDDKVLARIMPRDGKTTWLTAAVDAIAAHDPDAAERSMRHWLSALTMAVREGAGPS